MPIFILGKPINKNTLEACIQSYACQAYTGEWEIIIVNQSTEKNILEVFKNYYRQYRKISLETNSLTPQILMTENFEQAVNVATGDLILFSQCNYLLNQDYIENHVAAHSFEDCDVSMGYSVVKPEDTSSIELLKKLEKYPYLALEQQDKRDTINSSSFLNFKIGHLGIKQDFFKKKLSDFNLNNAKLFTIWDDINLGYKLYQKGVNVKFISNAYMIPCSHSKIIANLKKEDIFQDLKSFRQLLDTYPELTLIIRRWILEFYETICKHIELKNMSSNDDILYLNNLLKRNQTLSLSNVYKPTKKLKVLTYPWHIAHQYELYKLPYEFTLITDLGTWRATGWNLQQRPIPDNVSFKSIREINFNEFDLAILHFDENVLSPENANGLISKDWGDTFKFFQDEIQLPKVAVCHGTPQFFGQYNIKYKKYNLLQVIEEERQKLVNYLGNTLVINNSYQAQKEWNFTKSKVIWHGFDPTELPPCTYAKGILTPFGHAVTSRPHYRGYAIYTKVFEDFPSEHSPFVLSVREPNILLQGNEYAQVIFRNYVNNIRQYSIYFNPTIRSPMPRSRGEAMMCGLVTVSLKNHDVDLFIKNGVSGFYSEDILELRDFLLYLMKNPEETRKIGQRGREIAMDIFNHDLYLKAWQETISQLV